MGSEVVRLPTIDQAKPDQELQQPGREECMKAPPRHEKAFEESEGHLHGHNPNNYAALQDAITFAEGLSKWAALDSVAIGDWRVFQSKRRICGRELDA